MNETQKQFELSSLMGNYGHYINWKQLDVLLRFSMFGIFICTVKFYEKT